MDTLTIFFLSVFLSLVLFGLIARWYLLPWLHSVSWEEGLTPLLLLHSFRFIGLAFLVPGVVGPALTSAFAAPAAYGDLLTALLALAALIALRQKAGVTVPLLWLFNLVGTLDLLYAFFQGFSHDVVPSGQLGAAYFIPTIIVPALFVTHFIIFRWLLGAKSRQKMKLSPVA